MDSTDVVVVGSGPNGLAAAVTMARAGLAVQLLEAQPTIGGGARTLDLGLAPGVVHDLCSAVHPMALASEFMRSFDLAARGVDLAVPQVSYAQPLDGGAAGIAYRDVDLTAEHLGADGRAWRSLFEPLARASDDVVSLSMGDKRSVPDALRRPGGIATAARFALRLAEHGTPAWGARFGGEVAPALLAGVAAHSIATMPALAPAGTALLLGALGHSVGWPIPVGGSQAISDALLADLRAHGGVVHTSTPISDYRQLPRARTYLFDTSPSAVLDIWGQRLPAGVAAGFRRYRYGNAAAKVDFAISEPVPWANPEVGLAGTVHVGGNREQVVAAEAAVARGEHAPRPMVLLSDPAVSVPSRQVDGVRPLWTYAHVPAGSTRDVTADVVAQIERFAPGFRDVIVDSVCVPADRQVVHNANYVGGDIAAGAVTMYRMVARPSLRADPYSVGIPGVYLCSSATPPGPGVHGMSGWFAARRALRHRFGIDAPPDLSPGA